MNKDHLKKIIKPMIKECIKEVIFEEGTLSTIISEVIKGTNQTVITENYQQKPTVPSRLESSEQAVERKQKSLREQKRRMLDAIGKDAYNGIDLFEGTTPMKTSRGSMSPHGSKPMDGVDPRDPGVDLSSLGVNSQIWKKLAGN